jgi:hypothetical protein
MLFAKAPQPSPFQIDYCGALGILGSACRTTTAIV